MSIRYLYFLVIFWLATGCIQSKSSRPKPAISKDTLVYTNGIFTHYQKCLGKVDSNCVKVDLRYPDFQNQKVLNDTLAQKICKLFSAGNQPATNLEQLAGNFINQYNRAGIAKNRPGLVYELKINTNVIRQDSSLTTLELDGYTFQGGAHGLSLTKFVNWNTKANRSITLDDILIDGYKEQLTTVGERIFRRQEKLSDTSSLARDYFFKGAKFRLNSNYQLTPLGIRFLYNVYEIKPYAAGQTDLLIPYSQIKSLLQPNTVVKQYIK